MADLSHSMPSAVTSGAIRAEFVAESAKGVSERDYYKAFHDLESQIADLFHASTILDVMMNRFLGSTESKGDDVSFSMSRDEWETLFHSLYGVTNGSRDMRRDYYRSCQRLRPTGNA